MRLEGDDDAAVELLGGREHGRDLCGVMSVVVDDENAVRLAAEFEAPLGAAELREPGRDPLVRQPQLESHSNSRQRVLQVVPAGYRQRERSECLGCSWFDKPTTSVLRYRSS